MKRLLIITSALLLSSSESKDWGATGHRAIGEVATKHLSRKASKAIDRLLEGESLAFVSTYADEIRSDKKYNSYAPWHYVNMPLDKEYSDIQKNPKGDIVTTLKECIRVLKNPESSKESKSFYLKFLIHLVGDIHQPLHTGMFEDRGGNDIKLSFLGKPTNFHIVWDIHIIEYLNMDYLQISDELMLMNEVDFSLSPDEWVYETHQDVKILYPEIKNVINIEKDYINRKIPFIKHKLFKAGSTLAGVLNDIFS